MIIKRIRNICFIQAHGTDLFALFRENVDGGLSFTLHTGLCQIDRSVTIILHIKTIVVTLETDLNLVGLADIMERECRHCIVEDQGIGGQHRTIQPNRVNMVTIERGNNKGFVIAARRRNGSGADRATHIASSRLHIVYLFEIDTDRMVTCDILQRQYVGLQLIISCQPIHKYLANRIAIVGGKGDGERFAAGNFICPYICHRSICTSYDLHRIFIDREGGCNRLVFTNI